MRAPIQSNIRHIALTAGVSTGIRKYPTSVQSIHVSSEIPIFTSHCSRGGASHPLGALTT